MACCRRRPCRRRPNRAGTWANPQRTTRDADTSTAPTITLNLPPWTTHASANGRFGAAFFEESESCASPGGQSPCPADKDLKLRLISVTVYYPEDATLLPYKTPPLSLI